MKVFLDTNIFLEYFERRRQYQAVSQLLSAIEDGRLKAIVSAGCIYTLAYPASAADGTTGNVKDAATTDGL